MRQILTVATLLFIGIATTLTANAEVVDGTYKVSAGEISVVPPGTNAILVDRLIMEDKSTIRVSETPLFLLWAKHATAGNAASIVAQGSQGNFPGGDGRNGPTIILMLEDVNNVRGLTVASTGGNGAQGKAGHRGKKGKDSHCGISGGEPGMASGVATATRAVMPETVAESS